jgi:hypothetical protein
MQDSSIAVAFVLRPLCVVCAVQRAWRAFLNKRASRALAMMVLRAKVGFHCMWWIKVVDNWMDACVAACKQHCKTVVRRAWPVVGT